VSLSARLRRRSSSKPPASKRSAEVNKAAATKPQRKTPDVLVPRRPAGEAVSSEFFDRFPRFFETSRTSASRWRLNLRYDAIFAENRDVFAGARVLDIASHDGRWSLAALETGAAEVIGIEARPDLVEHARENLGQYVSDSTRYTFIAGDVLEVLGREKLQVDVVMCLGFLYHTLRYNELMSRIRELNPRDVIVDTQVTRDATNPVVRLSLDVAERQRDALADQYSFGGRILVGWPSIAAIKLMATAYGFDVSSFSDWGSLLRDNPDAHGVNDYVEARRVTAHLKSR
jgi:Methyltransferase domain